MIIIIISSSIINIIIIVFCIVFYNAHCNYDYNDYCNHDYPEHAHFFPLLATTRAAVIPQMRRVSFEFFEKVYYN